MTTETKPVKLSKRMKQLMVMLDQGLSNRDIAEQLDISEHTVKVHFWRLYQRLGVNSRGQALKWWNDNQPTGFQFAVRAAFDAACRLADQLKAGAAVDLAEFEHHRAAVNAMQGIRA